MRICIEGCSAAAQTDDKTRRGAETPSDTCEKLSTRVSSLLLVRFRLNDHSLPTRFGVHRFRLIGQISR